MLVILKIPIVYLCAVVWWAIKAEPLPEDGAEPAAGHEPYGPRPWWQPSRRRRRRRPGPHGMPARTARSAERSAFARGKVGR